MMFIMLFFDKTLDFHLWPSWHPGEVRSKCRLLSPTVPRSEYWGRIEDCWKQATLFYVNCGTFRLIYGGGQTLRLNGQDDLLRNLYIEIFFKYESYSNYFCRFS
jgi:hypothetical protein